MFMCSDRMDQMGFFMKISSLMTLWYVYQQLAGVHRLIQVVQQLPEPGNLLDCAGCRHVLCLISGCCHGRLLCGWTSWQRRRSASTDLAVERWVSSLPAWSASQKPKRP